MIEHGPVNFQNWAGNQRCVVTSFFQPETEAELIELVNRARQNGKHFRVVGAEHSWSDIACTDQWMVNLDRYSRVLHIDRERQQVRVQGGIRLKALNEMLHREGLALPNLGSISEQSIAGVISTATHGTGIRHGNLSAGVTALRLVTGKGMVQDFDESRTPEELKAARVGLGCLGIIAEVTLQCTTAFNLKETAAPLPFSEALQQLPGLLANNDHVKLWWFPHADIIQVYRYNRTTEPEQPPSRLARWQEDSWVADYTFRMFLWAGRVYPPLIPSINRFVQLLHFRNRERVNRSYRIFNIPMPPEHNETEYAIPVEHTQEALHGMKAMIEQEGFYINFVVEVRFVKGDDNWLSPVYGRDSAYIGAYFSGYRGWPEYLQRFEALMARYQGRPHWGKEFTLEWPQLASLYPRFHDFDRLRQKLDPEGVFENDFSRRVFGKKND